MALDLAVVIPVYNEEKHVAAVIYSYERVIESMGITYMIIVLDDGSRDRTPEILNGLRNGGHIQVSHLPNAVHGPAILRGYRMAVTQARWVFQCDSDNDIDARHFSEFWKHREKYDAVLGIRKGRKQSLSRSVISAGSRCAVFLLFGNRVTDVNCPFRLIRSSILAPVIKPIPDDTFAPNVIISGMLSKSASRILEINVPVKPEPSPRQKRSSTIIHRKSLLALRQTLCALVYAPRVVREMRNSLGKVLS
jgi:dolichol-phosphate mannosyltransferase